MQAAVAELLLGADDNTLAVAAAAASAAAVAVVSATDAAAAARSTPEALPAPPGEATPDTAAVVTTADADKVAGTPPCGIHTLPITTPPPRIGASPVPRTHTAAVAHEDGKAV